MAWPTRPYTLGEGLDRADNEIKAAKSKAASTRATLLAGGLSVEKAHNLLIQVLRIHGTLTTISQIPNIATYANEQLGENVGPAFVAALNAMVGVHSALLAVVPVHEASPKFWTMHPATGVLTDILIDEESTEGVALAAALQTLADV